MVQRIHQRSQMLVKQEMHLEGRKAQNEVKQNDLRLCLVHWQHINQQRDGLHQLFIELSRLFITLISRQLVVNLIPMRTHAHLDQISHCSTTLVGYMMWPHTIPKHITLNVTYQL